MFVEHFRNIYTNLGIDLWFIDNLGWAPTTDCAKTELRSPFFENKILSTLRSFESNKALDLMATQWNSLRKAGVRLGWIKDFSTHGMVNKVVNQTYIALSAKKEKCISITYYRPISLTIAFYRLVANTIAKRLKETLPCTISKNQMDFVKGRQITDAILIANKAIDYWRIKKNQRFRD